jgi:ectoine hydroxylase-related dioxygenase (phytanoyl-CoA dioxygenase family)
MKTHEVTLTDDQVAQFWEQGFLTLDRITSDEEIERLRQIYDELFSNKAGKEKGRFFDLGGVKGHEGEEVLPQVLGPERMYPELVESVYRRNAIEVGARLLGESHHKLTVFGHMILKPAGFGRETPWHQDEAYNPATDMDKHAVSLWMPLEEATVESGCMQFIPGSHRSEVVEHHPIDHNPLVHGLATDVVDASKAVACPLAPGAATVHYTRTMHYAGPNTSSRPRRAFIQVVSAPGRKRETPTSRPWLEEQRKAQIAAGIKQPTWDE